MRAFRLILLSSLYQSQLVVCNQGESDISLWLFELPKILPAGFCLETVLVLSCSPPHPQSWLQVKWPQSEERRTPVGDNEGFKPTVLWQGLCIACRKMWHQSTTLYKAPKPEPSALFVSVKWIQVRSRGKKCWLPFGSSDYFPVVFFSCTAVMHWLLMYAPVPIFTSVLGMLSCLLWCAYWTVGDLESFGFTGTECHIFKMKIMSVLAAIDKTHYAYMQFNV